MSRSSRCRKLCLRCGQRKAWSRAQMNRHRCPHGAVCENGKVPACCVIRVVTHGPIHVVTGVRDGDLLPPMMSSDRIEPSFLAAAKKAARFLKRGL